jgi:DNA mismatch repair protein MutL
VAPIFEYRLQVAAHATRALESAGDGPGIVLLHGWSDSADGWRRVLDELGARGASEVVAERLDHLFATMACHSVVRAGDLLGREQAAALLGQLDEVDLRSHCPHGRPVLLRMSLGEIERRFGRS